MTPNRVAVKLYLAEPGDIDPQAVIPIFHDWIRRGAVPGLLVDVADYSHVADGPGVLLIGHEADYALDLGEGRPGVLCRWKRGAEQTAADRLAFALEGALRAADAFEADPGLGGSPRFGRGEALIAVEDRLAAPNDPATLDALRPALDEAIARVLGAPPAGVSQVGEPDGPFAARVLLEPVSR
jgi:hypothetical protein